MLICAQSLAGATQEEYGLDLKMRGKLKALEL